MEVVIESLVSNDQSIVINNESPCIEFSKCENIVTVDDGKDKSLDINLSTLSSIIAEENGTGKYNLYI